MVGRFPADLGMKDVFLWVVVMEVDDDDDDDAVVSLLIWIVLCSCSLFFCRAL